MQRDPRCPPGMQPIPCQQQQASYVPISVIDAIAFGNGSGNIATWRKQNTLGSNLFYIVRTLWINTPTGSSTATIENGSSASSAAAQRLLDAFALTTSVPFVSNVWTTVSNNNYYQGFANNTTTVGAAYGYQYS
jgi:hypothetical protein